MMFEDISTARQYLKNADVFYDDFDDDPKLTQTLNMNDTFGWARAEGMYVEDKDLPELARLVWRYGWAGAVYWYSRQNGDMRSEFHDMNRFIDFVAMEEKLVKNIPGASERAYTKISYVLGGKPFTFWEKLRELWLL